MVRNMPRGRWFEHGHRGAIMGLWSGNASLGNIVGAGIAVMSFEVFGVSLGWKMALIIAATAVVLEAALVYRYLVSDPRDLITDEEICDDTDAESACTDSEESIEIDTLMSKQIQIEETKPPQDAPISFWKAWQIDGVFPYALTYACLKSVNYALFFWLPMYLTNSLQLPPSRANMLSMLYDFGQIIGGFAIGYITDMLDMQSPVIALLILGASALIQLLPTASESSIAGFLLTLGVFLGAPANLISTAISADLGTHPSLKGSAIALSTVTGIIDGSGSVGAAISQYIVGYLADCKLEPPQCSPASPPCATHCLWSPVLHFLQWLCLGCILCLSRLIFIELRDFTRRLRHSPA